MWGGQRWALLLYAATYGVAVQLDLQPGDTRCLGEELNEESQARFAFKLVRRGGAPVDDSAKAVTVVVSKPSGQSVYSRKLFDYEQKAFEHAGAAPGLYHICFTSGCDTIQRVDLEVTQLFDQEAFVRSIKAEALQPLELLLSRAEDAARAINAELDQSIQREAQLKRTSVNMEWHINAFATLSIVVLLGLSAWQMAFLRRFFRSKKLL
ncbi:emp24/gp25L/p24 family/GOLD-domain-containing protein [Tribonema minus]|uniref:Emp24/gp25L/p24 family/GOLD-domain-containing protein n=1 Tax=Tribonema minus TaxID=303371 RepID=A0A835YW86_9STRA|nr:emp24/gp25L/p24 family/GOLD-domain-containing protein [Tribonema minus]